MFSFTSTIFFILLDVLCSAILIGITITALSLIIFLVTQFIKAMIYTNKIDRKEK